MADVKITELPSANLVQRGDFFYLVQNDVSKNITAANVYASIIDPIINGRVLIGTNIQGVYDSNIVSYRDWETITDISGTSLRMRPLFPKVLPT